MGRRLGDGRLGDLGGGGVGLMGLMGRMGWMGGEGMGEWATGDLGGEGMWTAKREKARKRLRWGRRGGIMGA